MTSLCRLSLHLGIVRVRFRQFISEMILSFVELRRDVGSNRRMNQSTVSISAGYTKWRMFTKQEKMKELLQGSMPRLVDNKRNSIK